ncbi:hypothetical protein NHQ30_000939 [Ciborinia camelliae]|nr:hypothetical protein NHQ30_000939 [Ciborinia camelliae]
MLRLNESKMSFLISISIEPSISIRSTISAIVDHNLKQHIKTTNRSHHTHNYPPKQPKDNIRLRQDKMPTGALSLSIPESPTTPTTTTKHSATRPTFFPTVAWWKRFPRPSFPNYYSSYSNIHGYRNDTHDENGRRIMEEGLLSEGEREDFDGVIAGVGMGNASGSSYWKRVSDEASRGRLRLAVEVLGGLGVVIAVVGLVLLIFG